MQPAAIRVDRFGGARPRAGSRLLQSFEARAADNCRLWSGELGAWRRPSRVFPVGRNYLTNSNAFQNVAWTQTGLNGVTGNATTAPDGSVTADKLLESTANSQHKIAQTISKSSVAEFWTGAVSAKASERGYAWLAVGAGADFALVVVNLATGVQSSLQLGGVVTAPSVFIEAEAFGFWRIHLTTLTSAASTIALTAGISTDGTTISYAGTSNNGIFIDGASLRKSDIPGPYRETLATALPNDPQTIYGFRTTWFVFDEVANLASAPLSADTVDTTYFTRVSGEPRVTYSPIAEDTTGSGDLPRSSFSMGLPVPTSPPVVVASSSTGVITGASAQISSTGASTASSYTMVGVTTDGRTIRGKFHFKTNISTLVNQRATVRFVITRSGFTGEIAAMEQNLSFTPPSGSPQSQDVEYTLEFDDAPPAGTYNYVATVQIVFVGGGAFTATYSHNGATMRYTQTSVTSVAHGRVVGDTVQIAGVAGMEAINTGSTEVVAVPNANTFIVDIDSQGQAYTSGGVWTQVYADEDLEEVAYVMTWLSTIGSKVLEGPPSSPSNIITRGDGQLVQLSLINTSPPVDGGTYNLSGKRIYRTNVRSDLGANYQFVAELTVGTSSYNDTIRDVELGEVLPSTDWLKPPSTMRGVIELSNGVLAAFNGKDVCFSEPYQPHAWPVKYRLTAFSTVVGLVATGASIVVVTLGKPHFIHGTTPGEMEMIKIEAAQPCIAPLGIVDMGYAAVYPGDDGLVSINSGAVDIVTREHFTKEEWNDLNPSSIIAAEHDGRYVAFYTKADGTQGGFVLDPKEAAAKLTFLDFGASAVWTNPKTGDLHALIDEYICKWDSADDFYDFRWHSKTFETPTCNMGWARIQASDYPITLDLYANQDPANPDTLSLVTSTEVKDARHFRLPGDYLASLYEFELRGNGEGRVKQVDIATSIEDVTRGG
jgi:hypothetical protein